MKKKYFFILLLISIISLLLNSSELRLNGMSGISKTGLYVVPDLWCDSFFINPAYSSEDDKLLLNINNNVDISYSYSKDDEHEDLGFYYYDDERDSSTLRISPNNSFGMLIPINLFSFGFNINMDTDLYSRNSTSEYYSDTDEEEYFVNYSYLTGDLLFSWKINKYLNIGLKNQIKSKLFYYEKEMDNKEVNSQGELPINIEVNNNLGFLIKKDKVQTSISIPFDFHYSEIKLSDVYNNETDDWDYIKYIYKYRTGLKTVFDINISDKVLFRIPLETGIEITDTRRLYEDEDRADGLELDNDGYYYLKKYYCPLKLAFSVNNKITEKVLLFYGFDASLILNYEYEEIENDYYLHEKYNSINTGLFIGGEFELLKWLTLRVGAKSYLVTFSNYYFEENDETYSNKQVSFIQSTDFTSGLAFRPTSFAEIEVNANFLNVNINKQESKSEFGDYSSNSYKEENLTFEIEFGVVIKIDHKKSNNEDNKTDSDKTNNIDNSVL